MKELIHQILRISKILFYYTFWCICLLFPIDQRKVVICSYYGRGYGDNSKYIVDELLKKDNSLSLIWLVSNKSEIESLPLGVKGVKMNSIMGLYHLYTSKIWIDNCRKLYYILKRNNQFYIHTWHSFSLKKIEKDVEQSLGVLYLKNAKHDSKIINCIISCSDFMTNLYKTVFWYDGPVYAFGAPRNDIIINNDTSCIKKVYNEYNIHNDKKIALYAPTFRKDLSLEPYSVDYYRLKSACEKKFGGEFVVFVRLHPNIAKKSKNIYFDNENLFDATYYPDMQELLCASSIVVSDYSSLMFDFALTGKPAFQFATDIEEYKKDRGFYFELDKLPFPLAKSNDELENNIEAFNEVSYKEKLEKFYTDAGMIRDGKASERCAELILKVCGKNK